MGKHNDVRTFASGGSHEELIADTRDILNNNFHVVLFLELGAEFSQNWSALFVSPNTQGGSWCFHGGLSWGLGGLFNHWGFRCDGGLRRLGACAKEQSCNQSDCNE